MKFTELYEKQKINEASLNPKAKTELESIFLKEFERGARPYDVVHENEPKIITILKKERSFVGDEDRILNYAYKIAEDLKAQLGKATKNFFKKL